MCSEVPTVGGYTSDHVGMGIDFNNEKSMQCIMPFRS